MKRRFSFAALAAPAALALAIAAPATLAVEGQVIQMGDAALNCADIILQADQAAETLGGAPEGGLMTGENAVAIAQTAALHTGMGAAVPGLGAVGGLFRQASKARQEREEAARDVARSRWYYLNGLYAGRQCDQVLAAEAVAAEAAAGAGSGTD